eukprot:m.224641 g.224641  ORF g.224641 m.224641 type:complete len:269 (-) comp17294_c0_seq1:2350-3156(-)
MEVTISDSGQLSMTIPLLIRGKRFALKSCTITDGPFLEGLFADPVSMKTFADGNVRTPAETQKRIADVWLPRFEHGQPHGPFIIWNEETEQPYPVGFIVAGTSEYPGFSELAYIISPAYWGQGIASSATQAIVTLWGQYVRQKGLEGDERCTVFLGQVLRGFVATASPSNPGSWRVLEKAGLEKMTTTLNGKALPTLEIEQTSLMGLRGDTLWQAYEEHVLSQLALARDRGACKEDMFVTSTPDGHKVSMQVSERFGRLKLCYRKLLE